MVVELAGLVLWRGPRLPPVGLVEKVGVRLPFQLRFGGAILFETIEVFQEEQPGGLLGVVELRSAAGLLAEGIIDIFESLFEHEVTDIANCRSASPDWGRN